MPEPKFLAEANLGAFLGGLDAARKYANVLVEDVSLWKPLEGVPAEQVAAGLRAQRPLNPFKSVLMPARELVARYGEAEGEDPLETACRQAVALVGVRGCECRALAYLDSVMLSEPEEPFYKARRGQMTVISVDCAQPSAACFCNLLGDSPYPEKLFDVNLSPIDGGYVAEAGSEKGAELLQKSERILAQASQSHLAQKQAMRQKATQQLDEQNAEYGLPEDIKESLPQSIEGRFWRHEMSLCVQCGGCTAVCPTCYCFLLYDRQADGEAYERTRVWDSCQFTGYSVMAGPPGTRKPDPRRSHLSKFQHRFAHKFWYDPVNWGVLGCVGCGRCGQTCPGGIDLRRALTEVKEELVEHG